MSPFLPSYCAICSLFLLLAQSSGLLLPAVPCYSLLLLLSVVSVHPHVLCYFNLFCLYILSLCFSLILFCLSLMLFFLSLLPVSAAVSGSPIISVPVLRSCFPCHRWKWAVSAVTACCY